MSDQAAAQDLQAQNIALYSRLIEDGVGIGRLDTIDEVLAPGIQLPTIADLVEPTSAGLKRLNQAFRASFPDIRATIEQVFASGDWVAARLTWTGTNTGEFMGNPATGKTISISEIEIVRCQDGRIVELRQVVDLASLIAQLGEQG